MSSLDIVIQQADPAEPGVRALIRALDAHQQALYPDESNHLDEIETLQKSNVYLVAASLPNGTQVIGCGAIKFLQEPCADEDSSGMRRYGEIKRVFVAEPYRGKGVSGAIMAALEQYAGQQGINLLRLETGIYQPEAIGFYEKLGYRHCGAFGEYSAQDPYSVFMEKMLDS